MKFSNIKLLAVMLFSFFLSGCSIVGAAYDIVTLPIVIVGEAAGGIADIISDDDDDDDDRYERDDDRYERDDDDDDYDDDDDD